MSSANWLLWISKELNIMRFRQSEESIKALFKKLYKMLNMPSKDETHQHNYR